MLEVRRARAVDRHDGPFVAEHFRRGPPGVDHWLDRDRQSWNKLLAALWFPIVRHLWLFMKLGPNAMTNKVAHDAEFRALDDALDRGANIAHVIAWLGGGDAGGECLLRHREQALSFLIDFAHGDGHRAVGEVALVANADVD